MALCGGGMSVKMPTSFAPKGDSEAAPSMSLDELQLQNLGYKQTLHRTWHQGESFGASFCALNFIGSIRAFFFLGIAAGGPVALWSSYVVALVFMFIMAAVLAEICSALPLSSSVYIWAAKSAGPKYARFVGVMVAWWACTAWMTFSASNSQTTANYLVSLLALYEVNFPGGIDDSNIKWRAVVWILSEIFFLMGVAMAYVPPKWYSRFLRFGIGLIMLDFLLCLVWLPIGVSRTYGFRSAKDVFTASFNGTGAPPAWNWILSFLFTAGTLTGFEVSGHIAEETKNAGIVAARGIFGGAVATGMLGFITAILFLFCAPDFATVFSLGTPQPFVHIYAVTLGRGGAVFMSMIAIMGLVVNTSVAVVGASRIIFAVSRDGAWPGSKWISQVGNDGQPRHAVTVMLIFGGTLLCTIIPSQVAFASLVSAGGVFTIASSALIALLRFTMTPELFKSTRFQLGKFRRLFYLTGGLFHLLILAVMLSPLVFPVTADTFNFACLIFGSISIFAVTTWWLIPENKWLSEGQLRQMDSVITNSQST